MKPNVIKKNFSTWLLFGSLYSTQYLGLSFFIVALVAILREDGAPLEQISLIYLLGMIGACKFLWAPFIDKLKIGRNLGHYRSWLLLMQSSLVIILLVLSTLDLSTQFTAIYILCLLMTFISATQDIAVDGLVCRMLSSEERGLGNGIQTAGGMIGFMIGGGLILMAYPALGWMHSIWILAVGTSISLIQLIPFKEPVWPTTERSNQPVFRRFSTLWREMGGVTWISVLLCFPMGITIAYALTTPILVDAHWTLQRIGLVVNIIGPIIGMLSALLTGWLISRYGRQKIMMYSSVIQVMAILAIGTLALGYTTDLTVSFAISVYYFGYTPAMTLLCTLIMDHSSIQTPSTDYTLQYSLYQLFNLFIAGAGVFVAGKIGYIYTLSIAILLAIFAVTFSIRYWKWKALKSSHYV